MNRKAFYHLLKRYLEDDCTEEEKKLVEQWYELLGDEDAVPASDEEIKATVYRLWPSVEQTISKPPPRSRWLLYVGAAAAFAGIIIALFLFLPTERQSVHVARHSVKSDTLLLPDGSLVILEPNARLRYPDSFTVKREVYLEGNAFFKVVKNPEKPFYVYSRNIVTRVLGTSFFVKTGNDVEVSVCTGKVAVYEYSKDTNGVILKPNEKVIYNTGHFRTTLVEAPLLVAADNESTVKELNFEFEEAPISKVLAHLEKAYHIEMVLEHEDLANCLFTGDIKGQDLYGQLEIICQSVQASYEIKGTRILIKGAGCD